MRNQGLGSWPERRNRIAPHDVAIRFEGHSTTYRQWAIRVRRVAHFLQRAGIARGDRVAYLGVNHPASLEVLFACGQIGAIFVPINSRLSLEEIVFILGDSGCSTVVYGPDHAELAVAARASVPDLCHIFAVTPVGSEDPAFADTVRGSPDPSFDEPIDIVVDPDEICLLMYTSGTTGAPKGVMLSHDNMVFNAMNQILALNITSNDCALSVAPLFHIGGLGGAVTPVLMHGGTVVIVEKFDASEALRLIEAETVTTFFAVPTIVDRIARHPDFAGADLTRLRSLSVGGAPLPETLIGPWLARGVDIQQAYGMTETAPSGTMLIAADVSRKIGSAGTMSFFTDVDVVTADGRRAAVGAVGEVVLSGRNVMHGYWRNPESTAVALRDGWMHTGDAGEMDDEGYLYIRDRFKDMYISGGENVYPAEVESAMLRRPGIIAVAVIGVPDDQWGETGVAFVVTADGTPVDPHALRAELRNSLAPFKIPADIITIDELPTTGSGKIRKKALRDSHQKINLERQDNQNS